MSKDPTDFDALAAEVMTDPVAAGAARVREAEIAARKNEPPPVEKGTPCACGKPLPWHIFELGKLTHHCYCGLSWRNTEAGKDTDVRIVGFRQR